MLHNLDCVTEFPRVTPINIPTNKKRHNIILTHLNAGRMWRVKTLQRFILQNIVLRKLQKQRTRKHRTPEGTEQHNKHLTLNTEYVIHAENNSFFYGSPFYGSPFQPV